MLSYYFLLQYKRAKRKLNALGIQPMIGFLLIFLSFIILSKLLFYKTDLAPYLYALLALSFIVKLSESKRNENLSLLYEHSIYRLIRFIENHLVSLPFTIFLWIESEWIIATGLLFLSSGLSFFQLLTSMNWVIPTPFKRLSFEYIVGFRQYFWLVGILYFVMVQGTMVDNYNLAVVAMGFMFILGMSFFFKPEHLYYVWIYDKGFNQFIQHKIWMASIGIFILTVPAIAALFAVFPTEWLISLTVYLIAMLVNSSI